MTCIRINAFHSHRPLCGGSGASSWNVQDCTCSDCWMCSDLLIQRGQGRIWKPERPDGSSDSFTGFELAPDLLPFAPSPEDVEHMIRRVGWHGLSEMDVQVRSKRTYPL